MVIAISILLVVVVATDEALTFSLMEYDREKAMESRTMNAKINLKGTEDLSTVFGAPLIVYFDNGDEYCGEAYLNYFDGTESWLEFQHYGVSMQVSILP